MTTLPETEELERENVRRRHAVRLIEEGEEGTAIERLPGGVYGFTYAPAENLVPVFRKRGGQSFEIHRLADGEVRIVGFVTAGDAREIAAGNPGAEIRLYPEPYGNAAGITALPLHAIATSRRGPSREQGNYLSLRLA